MPFEFDSSTPLSIKNMNIRRPLTPLSTNNRRRAESYLKPASRPLKSILKNRNATITNTTRRSPIKQINTSPRKTSSSGRDLFSSLKDMGSKIFNQTENKPVVDDDVKPINYTTSKTESENVSSQLNTKILYLEKQIGVLEEQNFALLRANKTNLLKKEMEKQDLEIQNQLLKREVESLRKRQETTGNDSDIIQAFRSKVSHYDNSSIIKLSEMKNLYKMDDDDDDNDKTEKDDEMNSIRRKIQQRKQRKISEENELTEKISQMEKNILVLSSRLANNEPPKTSDLVLLQQIKQIIRDDNNKKKRSLRSDDDYTDIRTSKKMRASLSDSEQLSPIRF